MTLEGIDDVFLGLGVYLALFVGYGSEGNGLDEGIVAVDEVFAHLDVVDGCGIDHAVGVILVEGVKLDFAGDEVCLGVVGGLGVFHSLLDQGACLADLVGLA